MMNSFSQSSGIMPELISLSLHSKRRRLAMASPWPLLQQ